MKKKIVLLAICLFLTPLAVVAAPLTDFSKETIFYESTYRYSGNKIGKFDFDKKFNVERAITFGLDEKWALQYRNAPYVSGDDKLRIPDLRVTSKISTEELNAIYKIASNVSFFAGYVWTKTSIYTINGNSSDRKDIWQLGLGASMPLKSKLSVYAIAAAGAKWTNYEIGFSYAFNKKTDLNISYSSLKIKDLDFGRNGRMDAKANWFGIGTSYRFG